MEIARYTNELGMVFAMLPPGEFVQGSPAHELGHESSEEPQRGHRVVPPAAGATLEIEAMRAFMRETLPDYMIPAAFVVLETLPINPNGKIDRLALPDPETARPDLAAWRDRKLLRNGELRDAAEIRGGGSAARC